MLVITVKKNFEYIEQCNSNSIRSYVRIQYVCVLLIQHIL